MDDLVAGAADHQGLAPHLRHLGCPRGLAGSGFSGPGDLVDGHRGVVPAQFAPAAMCAVLSAKTCYAWSLRSGLHRGMRRAGDHARFWMLSVIVAG